MAYQVNYATVDLHKYVTILNVDRTVIPERTNFVKDISGVHGKYYMGYKYNERKIKLECLMRAESPEERVELLNEISFLLDVSEPQMLIIGDSPDTYCYAVPNSVSDIDSIRYNGKFEIEFISTFGKYIKMISYFRKPHVNIR